MRKLDDAVIRWVAQEYEKFGNFSAGMYYGNNVWKELYIWGRKAHSYGIIELLGFGKAKYKKGSRRGSYRWIVLGKGDILYFISLVLPYIKDEDKSKGLRLLRTLCLCMTDRGKKNTERNKRIIVETLEQIRQFKEIAD